MKKLFLVLAIATAFFACNNSTDATTSTTDSTMMETPVIADSIMAPMDTTTNPVTMPDSTIR